MTQLRSFRMTRKYKLAGIDCFLLQQDLPSIAEPMEGFVQLSHFSAYNPAKSMQAFNAKFRKRFGVDANIAAGAYDAVHFWAAAVEKAASFDPDRVAEAHEGMCREETHIGRQCIRKEDHQVVMDMHLPGEGRQEHPDRAHRRHGFDRRADGRPRPGGRIQLGDQEEELSWTISSPSCCRSSCTASSSAPRWGSWRSA